MNWTNSSWTNISYFSDLFMKSDFQGEPQFLVFFMGLVVGFLLGVFVIRFFLRRKQNSGGDVRIENYYAPEPSLPDPEIAKVQNRLKELGL